jgi:hypothetical protein
MSDGIEMRKYIIFDGGAPPLGEWKAGAREPIDEDSQAIHFA